MMTFLEKIVTYLQTLKCYNIVTKQSLNAQQRTPVICHLFGLPLSSYNWCSDIDLLLLTDFDIKYSIIALIYCFPFSSPENNFAMI